MRVAPVGLYMDIKSALDSGREIYGDDCDKLGAEVAALTHGHPLGYMPAFALARIIRFLVHNEKY